MFVWLDRMSDDSKVKRPDQQTMGGQLTSKAGTRIEFASRNVTSGTEEMDRSFLESGSGKFRGNWESPAEDEEHSTPDEETSSKLELSAKVENEESSSGTELSSDEQRSFFGQGTFFEKIDQEGTVSLPVGVKMDGEPSLDLPMSMGVGKPRFQEERGKGSERILGREDSSPRIELDEDSVTPGVHRNSTMDEGSVTPGVHRNSTKVTPAWREDTLCEPPQLHGDGEEERRAKQSFLDFR